MAKYKVLIKKCDDSQRAASIADEIAKWSGSATDTILAALTSKDVCIKKEAVENEASELKSKFEAVGASVELVKLGNGGAAAAVTTGAAVYDEDEDEEPGRVLSDEEYAEYLRSREDIFTIEKDSRLRNLELICILLAFLTGMWLSTQEIVDVATDFFEKMPEERVAKIVKELPETLKKSEEDKKKEEELKTEKKKLKPAKKKVQAEEPAVVVTQEPESQKKVYWE